MVLKENMVSFQEDVPISPEEAELPEMVPVTLSSDLPEFKHHTLERILAGTLLTWREFMRLVDIHTEDADYIIRGSNGTTFSLNHKIEDYVNTFRRKLKMYPVTLERAPGITLTNRGKRASTNSESSNPSRVLPPSSKSRTSKKLKVAKEDKRTRNQGKTTTEALRKIAQSVVQGQVSKRPYVKKADNKRGTAKSRSLTPPNAVDNERSKTSDPHAFVEAINEESTGEALAKGKLTRPSTDYRQVNDIVPSSSLTGVRKGTMPKNSCTSSRRSTKESNNTEVTQESNQDEEESCSDSDDEDEPSKEKKKMLKQNLIKYLKEKISPRSCLRLRTEITSLREQEKYFKVTTVLPLTAGMMEQAFCRKMTE